MHKFTREVQDAICADLELSVPEKYAAEANGIAESTFHDWMKQGRDGVDPYAGFSRAVTRARAKAVTNLTARALGGEKGSSQATWFLERRYRKEYGPIQKVELGGDPDGVPLRVQDELDKLNADELRKIAGESGS